MRRPAEYGFVKEFAQVASTATGEQPNLDFALAAVCRVLKLPSGSPLVLFAIGRSIGWIGHAMEQVRERTTDSATRRIVGVPARQEIVRSTC